MSGSDLARRIGVSRQAVHRHLRALVDEGRVHREGVTKGAVYRLGRGKTGVVHRTVSRQLQLAGLKEDQVYAERVQPILDGWRLSSQAVSILHYAFTEILNNAIDHSESERCRIQLGTRPYHATFKIRDFGVGIFSTIAAKYGAADEYEALRHLLKGKTTTAPDRHTGEGIFFTSRAADQMVIRSHRLQIRFENESKNTVVEELRFQSGTEVSFSIRSRSRRRLEDIFSRYAPEDFDYRFSKTDVQVRLLRDESISRSEARRLLHGLDRFRQVTLDFASVKQLGQGFADEVFRVWMVAYPNTTVRVRNLSPRLRPMIAHVVDEGAKDRLTIS